MLKLITLTALATALAAPAFAQDGEPEVRVESRMMFVSTDGGPGMDKDGDGFITREEFTAPMNDAWARLDKDGDGRVSVDELKSHGPDGDRDVMILRGPGGEGEPLRWRMEGPGGPGEHRFRIITDGEDVEGGERRVEIRRVGPGDGPMTWSSEEGERRVIILEGGPGGHGDFPMMFSGEGAPGEHSRIEIRRVGPDGAMDKDGDGRVSEEEFLAPMRDAFREMDKDNSGSLEEGERGGRHVIEHRAD